ncbi:hypothetical protein SAMN05421742_10287 [Roseospirillum parvum]|uniref:Uncharacterized protein n=1 Tax=Roseospirillum parvum TaxID=83401 RepID=A0A1G7W5I7_9PROT|nr:hypothetical protein SAMN05421742_10287 [Roseospirillum parvum]
MCLLAGMGPRVAGSRQGTGETYKAWEAGQLGTGAREPE